MYSLILTDIDGTLLQDDLTVAENTILAFRRAREKGIRIALSSGRYLHGLGFLKEEIGIDDIILSAINGALIKDQDRYLYKDPIKKEVYEEAAKILKGRAKSLIAFSESQYAIDSTDEFYLLQQRICRQSGTRMDLSSYDEVSSALGEQVYKLLLKDDNIANCAKIKNELLSIMGDRAEIIASYPYNFEILPKGTDKANAVLILEKELGIPKEEMIAFGDWDNDAGMLSLVGAGFAMANGSERAKAAAKYVTKDNNSDGIYYALHDILGII